MFCSQHYSPCSSIVLFFATPFVKYAFVQSFFQLSFVINLMLHRSIHDVAKILMQRVMEILHQLVEFLRIQFCTNLVHFSCILVLNLNISLDVANLVVRKVVRKNDTTISKSSETGSEGITGIDS